MNLRLFSLTLAIPFLGGCGCITSQHWDETLHDPAQLYEIESQIKTPEQREYWEEVKRNQDGAWIILEDSVDRERNRRR